MEQEVSFDMSGPLGLITLTRPKALNALTSDMCLRIYKMLKAWAKNPGIYTVVVEGEGEKAFCAGGDVVALYNAGQAYKGGDKKSTGWREFFWNEYRMNHAIHHFPKPYIAILDGITMGGGVGISVHGSHRIATDKTKFAMPETGLGLFPDVGGGHFLPRLPDNVGMYLALTGDRLGPAETCALGITQAYLPSSRVARFVSALVAAGALDHEVVDRIIAHFSDDPGDSKLEPHMKLIDRVFALDSVTDIIAALEREDNEWARKRAALLKTKSPTSMKVTFRQLREGASLSFDDDMRQEFRIACQTLQRHDFYEGVRSLLLEKDNNPKWDPASLAEVGDELVDTHFKPLRGKQLTFD